MSIDTGEQGRAGEKAQPHQYRHWCPDAIQRFSERLSQVQNLCLLVLTTLGDTCLKGVHLVGPYSSLEPNFLSTSTCKC